MNKDKICKNCLYRRKSTFDRSSFSCKKRGVFVSDTETCRIFHPDTDDRFKFRVWDKKNRFFQEEDADDCSIRFDGLLSCEFYGDYDTLPPSRVSEEDAAIEMCIGIKDKGGNLIYEGDYLLQDGFDLWLVVWDQDSAAFMLESYTFNEEEFVASGDLFYLENLPVRDMYVNGNIHEGILNRG